ncbi:non-specific lipid-transfer protein isoform X1 [Olea europaea var. sylvestris]|uniref:non-specific lipid-transfer protein isoform X1 n=1 Tax=Olea europaea var. sylvestris TaxID=158386 RepID=UPI000C1CCED5|nr:non-specific lipid-transfer protein isoform X1 [Olea europaea var. sylvestris]
MANSTQLKSEALMEQMKLHMSTDAGKKLVEKIGLVYQINIAPKKIGFNEKSFVVDLKKGEVKEGPYEDGKPDATFSFTDDDFLKVASGKMNPQIAFMRCVGWMQGCYEDKRELKCGPKIYTRYFPQTLEDVSGQVTMY